MKKTLSVFAIVLGIILALVIPGLSPRVVSAQVCYADTIIVPCAEPEKRNKTPVVYPSFTPTVTVTATPLPNDGQLDNGAMEKFSQMWQQILQMLSNIMKLLYEAMMAAVSKLKD